MRRSLIFAGRITSGKSGAPIGWDGNEDFSAWYVKNKSATSEKAILNLYGTNDIARTGGRLNGLIVKLEGKAATDLYGARAANICLRIPADADVSGPSSINCGLHVEAYGGLSIAGDFYGAYIYSAPGAVTGGSNAVLRLDSNVTEDGRNYAWISLVGGKGQYAMEFQPLGEQTAWSYVGTPTNISGWLKVRVAAFDRWIALYGTTP